MIVLITGSIYAEVIEQLQVILQRIINLGLITGNFYGEECKQIVLNPGYIAGIAISFQ